MTVDRAILLQIVMVTIFSVTHLVLLYDNKFDKFPRKFRMH